eukprot:TRINITY_DN25076_c1_g1_i1.p3 TRINITY_DN25076_c1_g1~~TRINITY_DN25076_c1_g1_i1.p3  ORF type:complete len:106 (+),score=9.46 TRINITY_DN25076_c1_g1_i1:373-690(+)
MNSFVDPQQSSSGPGVGFYQRITDFVILINQLSNLVQLFETVKQSLCLRFYIIKILILQVELLYQQQQQFVERSTRVIKLKEKQQQYFWDVFVCDDISKFRAGIQ